MATMSKKKASGPRKRGAGARGGQITTRKLTRGARKGQSVRGYITKSGKFKELKTKTRGTAGGQQTRAVGKGRVNAGKGNKRAGKKFASLRSATGQKIHRYNIGGKVVDVVVKPKKTSRTEQIKLVKKKVGAKR